MAWHSAIVAISMLIFTPGELTAQDSPHQIPADVLKYMDSRTAATGWVDLSKLDVEAVGKFRAQLTGIDEPLDAPKSIVDALVKSGVTRIYWVADLSGLSTGPRAIIVPVNGGGKDAVQGVLKSIVSDGKSRHDEEMTVVADGAILVGEKTVIEQLTSQREGEVNPDLLDAVKRNQGPHGFVVSTPVQAMLPIIVLLPKLTNTTPENTTKAADYLVNLKTVSVSGDLPPSHLTVRINTKSPATAAGLSQLINDWTTTQAPDLSKSIQFKNAENELMLDLNSQDEAIEALNAVKQIMFGSNQEAFNSLKHIALAMHNFHDSHGCFPPQSLASNDGRKLLSWRVLILPYLDQLALYNEFHLDEPWDSDHNRKLIPKMPDVFRSLPSGRSQLQPGMTRFVAPLTEKSVFGHSGPGTRISEITDGTSNTLMVLHVDEDRAVTWTKPEDVVISDDSPLDSIVTKATKEFAASLCDGSVRVFSRQIDADILRKLVDMNDGNVINWNDIE